MRFDSVVALERHERPLSIRIVLRAPRAHRLDQLGETVQALQMRLPRADLHRCAELFASLGALGENQRRAPASRGKRDIDDVLVARMGRDFATLRVDEPRGPPHFAIDPAQSELLAIGPAQDRAVRAMLPELDFADKRLEIAWSAPSREVLRLDERIEDQVARSTKKPCHEHGLPAQILAEGIFGKHSVLPFLHSDDRRRPSRSLAQAIPTPRTRGAAPALEVTTIPK